MGDPAGRLIFTDVTLIDREAVVSGPRTVVIAGGEIAEIREDPPAPLSGDEVVNAAGRFLTPGLVNLHTHSPMNIFRGIAEDVTPDDWFNREIWPYESRMDAGDVEAGARLAAAEMIDNGVTAFADHYFEAEIICRVAEETGMRLDMAPTLFGLTGGFDDQLAASEDLIRRWTGRSGRIALRLGPHAPYTCDPDQLAACTDAARRLGVGAHIHVEDDEAQIAASRERYGMTPLEMIHRAGLTEVPLILGHAYWILPEERPLLGKDTWIAVCMKTYQKLGTPPGRVLDRPEELPLAIGTDGAASSNSLNPLEQARMLGLAGKSRRADATAFPLAALWRMLMRGHEALPFGTGRLEPGAPADLVVWDLDRPHTSPVYDPLAALIYSADARNAEQVIAAGRFLKKDGRVQLDTAAIVREARDRARGILKKGKGPTKLVF